MSVSAGSGPSFPPTLIVLRGSAEVRPDDATRVTLICTTVNAVASSSWGGVRLARMLCTDASGDVRGAMVCPFYAPRPVLPFVRRAVRSVRVVLCFGVQCNVAAAASPHLVRGRSAFVGASSGCACAPQRGLFRHRETRRCAPPRIPVAAEPFR